jgi:leucyl-tRNA synthetase
MVDAEKMSKSRGNFLMLLECVEEYTADATRFALADAGDSLEDANFDRSVANQAITYLFNEEEWIKSVLLEISEGKLRSSAATSTVDYYFMDKAFSNEIDYLIEATLNDYNKMCFRDGIHRCWFDMLILRDIYRDWSIKCNIAMQKEIILRFIDALVKMILPICPHWSENIWELLGNTDSSVCFAVWPSFTSYDRQIRKEFSFFKDFMKNIRLTAIKLKINAPRSVYIYVANTYEKNKIKVLQYLQAAFNKEDGKFPVDFVKELKVFLESNEELKKETKFLIQFGAFMRDEAEDRGFDALAIDLPFNQRAIIEVELMFFSIFFIFRIMLLLILFLEL